jgi:hypothetical protein
MQEMTSEQFLLNQLQEEKFARLVKELTVHLPVYFPSRFCYRGD